MRRDTRLVRDMQTQLFKYRVARGWYLSDIPLDELCIEERINIAEDTTSLLFETNLVLKLVERNRKLVWRFLDKDSVYFNV